MEKLFIGNLPFSASESDIENLFETKGFKVKSAVVVLDRQTGRSRGFGFVELAEPERSAEAVEVMAGAELARRKLTINVAQPRKAA